MHEDTLHGLGLGTNEARVYIALLELGNTSVSTIAHQTKLHRTNVYDALHSLTAKGLVSYISRDKTTLYEAADPNRLRELIHERETSLQSILPELQLLKGLAPGKNTVHIFEGIRALRAMLKQFLETGKERVVYGLPQQVPQYLGIGWLDEYHKKRIAQKMMLRHIYNYEATERVRYLNNLPYTEARHLPREYDSPVSTMVCGNHVALVLWSEHDPVIIQIINEKIAQAYQRYFELLWQKATKP